MKWTGHNDYKAMKPYIDIADDIRANAMDKFNQLWLKRSKKSEYFDFSERFSIFAEKKVQWKGKSVIPLSSGKTIPKGSPSL